MIGSEIGYLLPLRDEFSFAVQHSDFSSFALLASGNTIWYCALDEMILLLDLSFCLFLFPSPLPCLLPSSPSSSDKTKKGEHKKPHPVWETLTQSKTNTQRSTYQETERFVIKTNLPSRTVTFEVLIHIFPLRYTIERTVEQEVVLLQMSWSQQGLDICSYREQSSYLPQGANASAHWHRCKIRVSISNCSSS